jgi:hypothetical protein
MHLKVFVKLKKTLKTLSSGQKNPKKPKKKKTQKKTLGRVFFFKPGFFQPCCTVFTMKISAIGEGGE